MIHLINYGCNECHSRFILLWAKDDLNPSEVAELIRWHHTKFKPDCKLKMVLVAASSIKTSKRVDGILQTRNARRN